MGNALVKDVVAGRTRKVCVRVNVGEGCSGRKDTKGMCACQL